MTFFNIIAFGQFKTSFLIQKRHNKRKLLFGYQENVSI